MGTSVTRTAAQVSKGSLSLGNGRETFVQTERAVHEAWGHFTVASPRAAGLLHHLCAFMSRDGAVVASHATLAKLSRMSVATVRRAVRDLESGNWIQVVAIGGKGAANAYVVNSRVGWMQARDNLRLATFSAQVVADVADQHTSALAGPPLRRLPILRQHELQLPTGPGEPPPAQPLLAGLEPDLPAVVE